MSHIAYHLNNHYVSPDITDCLLSYRQNMRISLSYYLLNITVLVLCEWSKNTTSDLLILVSDIS